MIIKFQILISNKIFFQWNYHPNSDVFIQWNILWSYWHQLGLGEISSTICQTDCWVGIPLSTTTILMFTVAAWYQEDCFTVTLHSTNGRHLPAVSAVQGDFQWPIENGGNSHQSRAPIMHCTLSTIHCSSLYLDRKSSCQHQPIEGHVSYPSWQSFNHQARTV